MYCTKCGTKIEDKYRFCPKCGQIKYKKEEPMAKKLCKILYYVFIVEVVISITLYLISTLFLILNGADAIEITLTATEMIINNILPVVAIFAFKKLSEKE